MAFAERTDYRTAKARHSFDPVSTLWRSEIGMHDLHYTESAGIWLPVAESRPAAVLRFIWGCAKTRHWTRLGDDSTRRWYPRRNVPTEFVEFGAPQAWNGTIWVDLNLSGATKPDAQTLFWDRTNYSLQLSMRWSGLKLVVVLKNSAAARRVRWPASLTGLTRSGWDVFSTTDSIAVGSVVPIIGVDATGLSVPIDTTIAGGFVEFNADLTGMTFPITIDPTFTSP